jgi:hypothetical protein
MPSLPHSIGQTWRIFLRCASYWSLEAASTYAPVWIWRGEVDVLLLIFASTGWTSPATIVLLCQLHHCSMHRKIFSIVHINTSKGTSKPTLSFRARSVAHVTR